MQKRLDITHCQLLNIFKNRNGYRLQFVKHRYCGRISEIHYIIEKN